MSENATRSALQQRIQALENEAVTLRKTVDRLQMSDKKYRRLVEHANEAVLVSQGGVFKYANPRAEVLFGFSQAELASRPLTDFIHPDDRDMVRARHEKRLRGEDPPDIYPFKILTKASQVRWVELKVSRFSWENAPAALCFLTDITARKQAQAALDKRLAALTRPFESATEIIFEELFALDDIQQLQDEFAQATGVASIITRTDGTPITQPSNFCRLCRDIIRKTEKGRTNCFKSDSILGCPNPDGPTVQPCLSGGLWNAGAAISVDGIHIANWLIGQVRNDAQTQTQIRVYAREIGADEEAAVQAFREVPAMSREQFQKLAQVLFTLAKQLSANVFQNVQQARYIADLKSAETALRESETRFRNMFEQAPVSYQSLDEHGNFTTVNQTWLQTMGYTREEVLGKNFSEFLKPEWRGHFEENFPRFKAVGEVLGVEFEMVKKDGATILVSFHGKIEKDDKGNFDRTHCVFRDVSLEKSAADTLKREAGLHRAIADISKELLSEIYDITQVSEVTLKSAQELTGSAHGFVSSIDKTTLENVGHTLTDMFGEKCQMKDQRIAFPLGPDGKYAALWGHILNTKQSFFTNQPATHTSAKGVPAGHIPLENYMAVPVILEGTISGMIALANADRDYTDSDIDTVERLADTFTFALHRNRYELEKQSMEKQLQQMQKLEAIGALAGGIAHDFNNILFPIVGMSEMLLEDLPPDSPEWENADEIYRAGKRGSNLVKQILTFSRQTEHKAIPLRIQSILKEVVKLARATIPADIQIVQHIQPDCGLVLADPTQLHQVAMNLLTNALHAVGNFHGQIEITLAEVTIKESDMPGSDLPPGQYVRMTVSDTGSGIEPALLEKIFEPYFTTKAQGKGTGLGLAMVHGIIREYRGDIRVVSRAGEGTTFSIYLPLLQHSDGPSELEQSDFNESGTGHILLVDDERAIVNLEKQILERLGYSVTFCLNSVEAIETFRVHPDAYDLVITDMAMPNITGDQLAEEMFSIRPDLPIIICTGFSERINAERAREIGVKGFLLKPIIKSDLAKMVREVLDGVNND